MNVTLYQAVNIYRGFKGLKCLNLLWLLDPEDECNTIHQNISIYKPVWCNIQEDMNIQQHSCENLRSHNPLVMDLNLESIHLVVHICMSLLFVTVYLFIYSSSKFSLSLFCPALLCLCLKFGCSLYLFLFQTLLLPYLPRTVWSPLYKIQFAGTNLCRTLLGAFTKLRKVTISFVMSICPRGTNRLPLDGFSWNLIFEQFLKIC